ncbi:MAG: cohesin domain-containing protein [Brevefilum sp.]
MKRNFYRVILVFLALFLLIFAGFQSVLAQDVEPAEAGVFQDLEVLPNAQFEVPVSIRNVEDLYAVDIIIEFDPDILVAEDADPEKDGVGLAVGTFLDPGLVLFNTVDNGSGTARLTMTQVNPSEPKSGEGVLLVLYFRALAAGESDLTITSVELSDRGGNTIPAEGVNSTIIVSSEAVEQESTPIPVQNPTEAIIVPTLAPTASPTPTPTESPTPTATEEPEAEQRAVSHEEISGDEGRGASENEAMSEDASWDETQNRISLLDYWWLVALVVLIAIGMGLYLLISKRQ